MLEKKRNGKFKKRKGKQKNCIINLRRIAQLGRALGF